MLRERESEAARDVVAYRTKSESQTKDLRYALEQVLKEVEGEGERGRGGGGRDKISDSNIFSSFLL